MPIASADAAMICCRSPVAARACGAELLDRGVAALYAGAAAMFWLDRSASALPARTGTRNRLALACLPVAASGVFELLVGHVTAGILNAGVIERALAVALLQLALTYEGNSK